MRIEPLHFRDFDAEGLTAVSSGPKRISTSGRRKEEVPPPPPPPPTFSEEQLKAAERESYKKGFLEGTQEGIQQAHSEQAIINNQLMENSAHFAQSLSPLLADYRQMIVQMRQDMPKVALAIARKVAGAALEENAGKAVEEVALRCVDTMIAEPKLAITVHESLAASLQDKLQMIAGRLQSAADIVVVASADMAHADCRIEWKHGAMERHTGQLWQQIERAVESMIATSERETNKQIEALIQLPAPETGIIS